MNSIKSFNEIGVIFSRIKSLRKGFLTNFYPDPSKVDLWIQKQIFYCFEVRDTCFFLKDNDGFRNLYYAAPDAVYLAEALALFIAEYPQQTFVVDLVGMGTSGDTKGVFLDKGFQQYTSLVRMNRIAPVHVLEWDLDPAVSRARVTDLLQIDALFKVHFDPLSEQIPFQEEIERWINQGHILVSKDENKLTGFIIFDLAPATLYLRYWFVHPDYRDQKIGSKLFKQFLFQGKNTKRQLFWVIESNENAIKRYRHFGFKEENLHNFVLIKGQTYEK